MVRLSLSFRGSDLRAVPHPPSQYLNPPLSALAFVIELYGGLVRAQTFGDFLRRVLCLRGGRLQIDSRLFNIHCTCLVEHGTVAFSTIRCLTVSSSAGVFPAPKNVVGHVLAYCSVVQDR